ncbi:hypothetical protein [uncultured Winogradskyella sp.]|uniref:hypothetical protein n=1 Tax=Winogradskyella sp. 4-2091 TaxID=3381659 RepID=UPI002636ECF8|nr:hypothetical protein [uncultured Winogradskyella sp.]
MSNPFKKITSNAAQSKNSMYNTEAHNETTVSTRDCDTCGAPRPKKSDLTICSYCKTSFMDIGTVIKSDN